jgi:hypothetical protein
MPCLIVLGIVGGIFLLLVTCNAEKPSPPTAQETRASEETIATAINLSGNLCAKVTLVTPTLSSGERQVNCEEYRDPRKSGTKNNMVVYMVNPERGTVRLMGRS